MELIYSIPFFFISACFCLHQSPSSSKKKRKSLGADNEDDDNDEGLFVSSFISLFKCPLIDASFFSLQLFLQNVERVKRQ